jgi:hypothetical protein
MFCSILIQCLYQLYNYYNLFGIVHYDCNASNIMININPDLQDEVIRYEFNKYPFRFYKDTFKCDEIHYNYLSVNVKTYGIKALIIDFDRANILHIDYIKDKTIPLTSQVNIIDRIKDFIKNIYTYAPSEIKIILEKYFKDSEYTNTIACCERYIDTYNKSFKDFPNNDYFIGKTSYILHHHIGNLTELLKMPKEYNIYSKN